MGALFLSFGTILQILGLIEWKITEMSEEEGDEELSEEIRIPALEYGGMTGFIGSLVAFALLAGFLSLFKIKTYQMSGQLFYLQALSLPIGIILGYLAKTLSKRMRIRFDVWYVSLYDFTKISIVTFSFIGTLLYTMFLYLLDIILTA